MAQSRLLPVKALCTKSVMIIMIPRILQQATRTEMAVMRGEGCSETEVWIAVVNLMLFPSGDVSKLSDPLYIIMLPHGECRRSASVT